MSSMEGILVHFWRKRGCGFVTQFCLWTGHGCHQTQVIMVISSHPPCPGLALDDQGTQHQALDKSVVFVILCQG